MAHLFCNERKVSTSGQAPAGVSVSGLVWPARTNTRAFLDSCPFCVPSGGDIPEVDYFLACLGCRREQWCDVILPAFVPVLENFNSPLGVLSLIHI